MIPMVSIAPHIYAGKRLKVGDKFEARGESDARVMRALKRAVDEESAPYVPSEPYVPPVRKYTPKVLEAEKPADAKPADTSTSGLVSGMGTRRYQRRDLTAKE